MKYNTADDRLIRVGDAYNYWRDKAETVSQFNDAKILRNMLDEVPSAKLDIITCEECKMMEPSKTYPELMYCDYIEGYVDNNDFCSKAVRKDVEHD